MSAWGVTMTEQHPKAPLPVRPYPGEEAAADEGGALPPVSTSLDTTETTVNDPIRAFLAEKPAAKIDYETKLWQTSAESFRHSGWRGIREKVFGALKRTGQSASRICSFASCGNGCSVQRREMKLGGYEYRICGSCCHDRLCTPCAATRAWRVQLALRNLMEGKRLSFITLTLAGQNESLSDKIDRLYKGFRALRLHPLFADAVRGGVAFLEIKHSAKAGRWHPHLHLICEAGYIDQGELSNVWRGITKDSFVVDIRRVKEEAQAASYVTKYASKPLNTSFCHDPALLDESVLALKGRRLVFAFGEWYGEALDIDADSLLDEGEEGSESWVNFMPLDMLLEQCNSGDRDSIAILIKAGGETAWRRSLDSGP